MVNCGRRPSHLYNCSGIEPSKRTKNTSYQPRYLLYLGMSPFLVAPGSLAVPHCSQGLSRSDFTGSCLRKPAWVWGVPKSMRERTEPRSSDPSDLRLIAWDAPSVSLMEMSCHAAQRMACISQLHLKAWAVQLR